MSVAIEQNGWGHPYQCSGYGLDRLGPLADNAEIRTALPIFGSRKTHLTTFFSAAKLMFFSEDGEQVNLDAGCRAQPAGLPQAER